MADTTAEERMASYISGNVKRKQVLDVLHKNGRETPDGLHKLTRMPAIMLKSVLRDMEEKGVIAPDGDGYRLTEDGLRAANALPRQATKAGGKRFDANIRREI